MSRDILRAALSHPNVKAFIRVIREGESRQDDRAYHMRYGGAGNPPAYFDDLSKHPQVYELTPDGRKSSAAGAPQATYTTWSEEQKRWGWTDFGKDAQDEFFVARFIYRGALDDVREGRFEEACRKLHDEWTSLPGGREENAATARARETYLKWGGYLSAADTLATEHYGERVDESVIRPVPSADEQEEHMAPIIAAILPTLIKAAPDLIRLFGKGEQSDRNALVAEKVGALAVQVTGAVNEQEAARVLASSPAKAQEFRAAVADNFDQWMGMAVKFHGLEEESRQRAREAASGQSGDWRKLLFSLPFVGLVLFIPAVWAVVAASVFEFPWLQKMDPQLRGTVVGFVLGTIAASIVGYIYGASMTKAPPQPQQPQR